MARNDERYADRLGRLVSDECDRWLERWRDVLERAKNGAVLELGCGGGRDSRFLTDLGLTVVAGDLSEEALEICRRRAPLADVRRIDLREPLPFPDETFPVIVAGLCLHFFDWPGTMAAMAEIRRCLTPGGFLLMRVNSTHDINRVAGHEEIESNLFLVKWGLKRFFDQESMERLIGTGWRVHCLEELTVDRYGVPKVLWEAVLEKAPEV